MDNPPLTDDLLYSLRPSFTGHVQSPRLVVPRSCRYVVGWLSLSKPLVSGVWPKQDLNDLNVATLYFLISSWSYWSSRVQESRFHVFSIFFKDVYWILYWYSMFNQLWDDPQSPTESRDAISGSLRRHISKWPSISATLGVLFLNTFSQIAGSISGDQLYYIIIFTYSWSISLGYSYTSYRYRLQMVTLW